MFVAANLISVNKDAEKHVRVDMSDVSLLQSYCTLSIVFNQTHYSDMQNITPL